MGQYTEMSIQIQCKSDESAQKVADQVQNFEEYVASKRDGKPFSVSIGDIYVSEGSALVEVQLHSDRFPNAEWQTQQLLSMCKELFKGEVTTFIADYTVPETLIYQEFDDKGEQI